MQDQRFPGPDSGGAPPPASFPLATAQAVRFYSRIPVPRLPGEMDMHALPDFATMPRALPLAALIIAAPPSATLILASILGLPPLLSAVLTVAALVLTTGAFHEDGLADTADGFGGGATVARKLEIMKDSRVGTYGATALALSLLLRVAALAALIDMRPTGYAVAVLVAAAIFSRLAGLLPLAMLPPARDDGASAAVGRPTRAALIFAFALAAAIAAACSALALWPLGLGPAMIAASLIAGLGVTRLAARQIGGQTGDVAGAAQQVAEIACLIAPLVTVFSP